MIRQLPGSRNAVGQVEFIVPNSYSVHLHDTPSRSLFEKLERLYGSGCVRVESHWDFADGYHDAIARFGHGFMRYHSSRNSLVSEQDPRSTRMWWRPAMSITT